MAERMFMRALLVHVPAQEAMDADWNTHGHLSIQARAAFGTAAMDAGTPDRGQGRRRDGRRGHDRQRPPRALPVQGDVRPGRHGVYTGQDIASGRFVARVFWDANDLDGGGLVVRFHDRADEFPDSVEGVAEALEFVAGCTLDATSLEEIRALTS